MQDKISTIIKRHKYSLIICSLFAFLYILPLLLANVYYTDDMRRAITGLGWRHDGRHLASFLMSKLTGGGRISDFFPFNTIFSAMIFAFSGYIVSLVLELEQHSKIKFSALILLISPFLLENLSYRWDSIPMSISVLAIVIPFLFISSKKTFTILSILGICITTFTYQASIVIYPLMAILVLISLCLKKDEFKQIMRFTILSLVSFLIGMTLYKLLSLLLPALSVADRGRFILFADNPIGEFSLNLDSTWLLIKSGFSRFYTILSIISLLIALIAYVKFALSHKPLANKFSVVLLALLMLPIVPAVLLFLKDAWAYPRALIGFSFFSYLILLLVNNLSGKITSILSILFILLALPLMSSYANALKSQNSLEVSIAERITQVIDVNNKNIAFSGQLQYSPETYVALEKYPLLNYLVPSYMKNDWMWGGMIFNKATNYMFLPNFTQGEEFKELIKIKDSLPIVDKTRFYTLRADSTQIIIDFKHPLVNK